MQTHLSVLWATSLSPTHGLRHGGTLRFASLSRELAERGHQVRAVGLLARNATSSDENALLASLLQEFRIADFVFVPPAVIPGRAMRLSRIGLTPKVRYRLLGRFVRPLATELDRLIRTFDVNALVIGSRQFLPVVPWLSEQVPTFIDWCDSEILARLRETRSALKARQVWRALHHIHNMGQAFLEERDYGREAAMNLVASPVDKRWLDLATGRPARSHVVGNGVVLGPGHALVKEPDRLMFSGNMDFPPNYTAAIWFIDHVLPLVAARRPDVEFIVAGQFPTRTLLERAHGRVRVVGYVDDLRAAISSSALYVAPMVSGSGFKNKVVEALASGTFVAATPMGVEFLPRAIREKLIVGRGPEELATAIVAFLDAPHLYTDRLRSAVEAVGKAYSWSSQAGELERVMMATMGRWPREVTGAAR